MGMKHAHRTEATNVSQAPRSRCLTSPYCGLPGSVSRRFGGIGGLWLHYGPIGRETTPLSVHGGDAVASEAPAEPLVVATCRDWRAYPGFRIDMFCLEHRPGPGATCHQPNDPAFPRGLWRVYGVSWRDVGGLKVVWKAPGFGLRQEGWHQVSPTRQTASTSAELSRLEDLLEGRGPRPGRPPRWRDPSWRDVTLRAEARKTAHPGLPWDDIARALGVNPSTLREYRRLLRREAHEHHEHLEIRLLDGGDSA